MDITLEKIDIVRERAKATYKEARDALTAANGNVIDAIISLEESGEKDWTETMTVKGNEVAEKIKTIISTGNVNRIRVKKDNNVIIDIPVTAGAISAVVLPQITALGTAVALLTKCTIEVERQNKGVINVNSVINTAVCDAADKVKNIAEDVKNMTNTNSNAQQNTMQAQQNNNQGNTPPTENN